MAGATKKYIPSGSGRTGVVRGRVALIVILVFMVLLCVRFAYLQLIDPNDYRTSALDQYTSSVTIPAKRGSIYANDAATELAVSATVSLRKIVKKHPRLSTAKPCCITCLTVFRVYFRLTATKSN